MGLQFWHLAHYYRPRTMVLRKLNTRYDGLPMQFFRRRLRILDAGGGPSDALKAKSMLDDCWYEGINIEELPPASKQRRAYDRYHLVDLDKSDLAFLPDWSFDLVASSHTIEHLEDGLRVVALLCDKVKPGGFLYLEWPSVESVTFPIRGRGLRFDDDVTHRSTYGLAEMAALVTGQGLRIEFARRRRQWLRILLGPFLIAYHSFRFRRVVLYDLWDVTGFCYALRAIRPASGVVTKIADS
jgi:SAM-dependent methyltransferase